MDRKAVLTGVLCAMAAASLAIVLIAGAQRFLQQRLDIPLHRHTAAMGQFEVLSGQARTGDQNIILSPGRQPVVLVDNSPPPALKRMTHLRLNLSPAESRPSAEFIWALEEAPEQTLIKQLALHSPVISLPLNDLDNWHQELAGYGIAFTPSATQTAFSLEFQQRSTSLGNAISLLLNNWTTLPGYHAHSVNRVSFDSHQASWLGAAIGLSVVFSVVALYILGRRLHWQRPQFQSSLAGGLLILWLPGFLWVISQSHVEQKLTREEFTNAEPATASLAPVDAELITKAQRIESALPAPPQRIILLNKNCTDRLSNDFERTRMAYHLLPHNSLARECRLPQPDHNRVRPGDFIAVLDPQHESFRAIANTIQPGYKVETVFQESHLAVHRVLGND